MTKAGEGASFRTLYDRAAARVRGRLLGRYVMSGVTGGVLVFVLVAGAGLLAHAEGARRWAPACVIAGAIGGFVRGRSKRWSDTDIGLYLDERLGSGEAITTALSVGRTSHADLAFEEEVKDAATRALATAPKVPAPRTILRAHGAIPVLVIAGVALLRMPMPAPAEPPEGGTVIPGAPLPGLEKIEKLAALPARDDAQEQRLSELAKRAADLREEARQGLEKKEALERLGRLRDGLVEERLGLGSGRGQVGLEAAAARLRQAGLSAAAQALEARSMSALDEAAERLANQRELADREAARRALEDAAKAAREAGASDVAKALEAEAGRFAERERRAGLLRDLADAMGAVAQGTPSSEPLDREGSDKSARALADALGQALEGLSAEERKRLAERLRAMAGGGRSGADADALRDMAEGLATPEGRKRLEERLKELAKEDPALDEALRERALDDALGGADEAQRSLEGAVPAPGGGAGRPGAGNAGQGSAHASPGESGAGTGGGAASGDPGGGGGGGASQGGGGTDHAGPAGSALGAASMPARARPTLGRGPAVGGATTFAPGQAGARSQTEGGRDVASAAPKELAGIERSEVPEAYRAQVRRYFRP